MTVDRYLKVAVEAARRAGRLLLRYSGGDVAVRRKGPINLVTQADLDSEREIVEVIRWHFPDHQFLAEEGRYPQPRSSFRWIIDPLDGTTNFAHGYPCFSVSIALEARGRVLLGVVYQPVLGELFTAVRGEGAYLRPGDSGKKRKIAVSRTRRLAESLLATGFPYDIHTNPENNLDHFANFAFSATAIRRAGSAALDLCYVGCGRFDGFWELRLSPWDLAAGSLIVMEAGGRVTDFAGNRASIYGSAIVASNGLIHKEMLEVLTKRRPIAAKIKAFSRQPSAARGQWKLKADG